MSCKQFNHDTNASGEYDHESYAWYNDADGSVLRLIPHREAYLAGGGTPDLMHGDLIGWVLELESADSQTLRLQCWPDPDNAAPRAAFLGRLPDADAKVFALDMAYVTPTRESAGVYGAVRYAHRLATEGRYALWHIVYVGRVSDVIEFYQVVETRMTTETPVHFSLPDSWLAGTSIYDFSAAYDLFRQLVAGTYRATIECLMRVNQYLDLDA